MALIATIMIGSSLLVLLNALKLTSPASSAEDPPSFNSLCETARAQLESDPQGALAMIETLRDPALERLNAGVGLPRDGELANACEAEWLAAVSRIYGVSTGDLQPGFVLVSVFAWLGITVVLTRLLTLLHAAPWGSSTMRRRRSWLAWGGLSASASLFAFGAAVFFAWRAETIWLIAAAELFGCFFLARWLSARPTLAVQVLMPTGARSASQTTHLDTVIRDLGTANQLSPETHPSLTPHLVETAQPSAAGYLLRAVRVATGCVPWVADLGLLEDGTAVLRVRRNGHVVSSRAFRGRKYQDPRIGWPLPDTSGNWLDERRVRWAAAYITATVIAEYPDMQSAYATTAPEGLVFWAFGRSDYLSTSVRREFLARARREDTENLSIDVSLAELVWPSTDPDARERLEALIDRASKLTQIPNPLRPHSEAPRTTGRRSRSSPSSREPLVRLLNLYILMGKRWFVQENRIDRPHRTDITDVIRAAKQTPVIEPAAIEEIVRLAHSFDNARNSMDSDYSVLVRALNSQIAILGDGTGSRGSMLSVLQMQAAISARAIAEIGQRAFSGQEQDWSDSLKTAIARTEHWWLDATRSTNPQIEYELACFYAQSNEAAASMSDAPGGSRRVQALRLLGASVTQDPECRARARHDPALDPLRSTGTPRGLAAAAPLELDRIWAVPPLAHVAERLHAIGLTELRDLGNAPLNGLSRYLHISHAEFRHLTQVATLGATLQEDPLLGLRAHEILSALLSCGMDSIDKLSISWATRKEQLLTSLEGRLDAAGYTVSRSSVEFLMGRVLGLNSVLPDESPSSKSDMPITG